MAKFITLTSARAQTKVRINPSCIATFRPVAEQEAERWPLAESAVNLPDETVYVTETPEQIDAMLGVTESRSDGAAIEALRRISKIHRGSIDDDVLLTAVNRLNSAIGIAENALRAARGE